MLFTDPRHTGHSAVFVGSLPPFHSLDRHIASPQTGRDRFRSHLLFHSTFSSKLAIVDQGTEVMLCSHSHQTAPSAGNARMERTHSAVSNLCVQHVDDLKCYFDSCEPHTVRGADSDAYAKVGYHPPKRYQRYTRSLMMMINLAAPAVSILARGSPID